MHGLTSVCPAAVEYKPQQKTELIWALLLWVLLLAPARLIAAQDQPLRISRVTPSGLDVTPGKQIVIQFNQPVVPLGRMARSAEEIPIRITPVLACQWRWLNTSALACQLEDAAALQPSQHYHLTVQPGQTGQAEQAVLRTTDGKILTEPYEHYFTTERARIRSAYFRTWKAPGWPVIRLVFNQPVSQESVAQHVFLTPGPNTTDSAENRTTPRYPVSVQADPADPEDQKLPRFFRVPGENYWLDFGDPANRKSRKNQKSDDDLTDMNGEEARRVWLVSPQSELPLDTGMQLWTEPGIESALGPERSVDSRMVVEFHTFPEFVFRGVRCWDKKDERIFIEIEKEHAATPALKCNPLRSVALAFSAPVLASEIKQYVRFDPDLAGGRNDYDPWANQHDASSLDAPHYQDRLYSIYLPERLRAAREYRLTLEPDSLKDEFGRTLSEALDFRFFTDHRNPDYTLANPTAVLEQHADTQVPLYVTNLDQVRLRYKKLTQDARQEDQELRLNPAQVEDLSFAIPLGVRQALGEQSGVVYGTLETTPHVEKWEQARTVFAQVTPYAVHVKLGHFNTLVWVTDLASGQPVPDARVRFYKDAVASLSAEPQVLSEGQTNADGIVLLPGTERVDPQLETFRHWSDDQAERLVVRIDTEAAMALVPLDPSRFRIWTYRVSNWEVSEQEQKIYGHMHAWGTTAQGIYRTGDTIQYKIYVRDQDNARFIPPPRNGYSLEIIDPQGKTVHEATDLSLSEFGGYHGSFAVPQTAAVGWYSFTLRANFTDQSWQPLRVLVSDFTPASFRVTNTLNGDHFRPEARIEIETRARLHSGGPYTDAITRVTALLKPKPFTSDHALAKGFVFGSGGQPNQRSQQIFQRRGYVNDRGDLLSAFSIPPSPVLYGALVVESAVQDDRGKFIATTARDAYVGVDRFVGLQNTAWLYQEDESAEVQLLVVDEQGIPVAGTSVAVSIERQVTKAARVKGAGNAYQTLRDPHET